MKYFIPFLSLLLFSVTTLLAQGPITGFMPNKRTTDIALTYSDENYSQYYFGDDLQEQNNHTKSLNLFIEHGFNDSLSLVASIPYNYIDEVNKGLQDANLYIKYRNQHNQFEKSELSLVTAIGLRFPLSAYPTDTETPIGDRSVAFQGRFLGQFRLYSGWFIHLQSGLDFRLIPTAQASLPILFRTGFGTRKIYVDGWLELQKTFNSGVDIQVNGGSGSSWTKIGGTLFYNLTPTLGVFVSGSKILSGRNIGLARRLNTGLVFKWVKGRKRR